MTFKGITLILLLLALFGSLVSADDETRPRGAPTVSSVLLEATGLDAEQLRQALRDGATPAELIEANGGDVSAVTEALVAEATSAIEASMSARLAEMDERLEAWLNGETDEGVHRAPFRSRVIPAALAEATGLDADALRQALDAGSTPAELIEANDGDVAAVTAAMAAEARGALEAAMERQIANLDARAAAWLNGERGIVRQRVIVGGKAAQAIMEEATGLDATALREALDAGATPSDLIEANGGNVSAVMDALVMEARTAQQEMRARFDDMRSRFGEVMGKFGRGFWRGPGRWAPQG